MASLWRKRVWNWFRYRRIILSKYLVERLIVWCKAETHGIKAPTRVRYDLPLMRNRRIWHRSFCTGPCLWSCMRPRTGRRSQRQTLEMVSLLATDLRAALPSPVSTNEAWNWSTLCSFVQLVGPVSLRLLSKVFREKVTLEALFQCEYWFYAKMPNKAWSMEVSKTEFCKNGVSCWKQSYRSWFPFTDKISDAYASCWIFETIFQKVRFNSVAVK